MTEIPTWEKNLDGSVAIYGRGRELFRAHTYFSPAITPLFHSFVHLLFILSIHTRSETEPIGYKARHDAMYSRHKIRVTYIHFIMNSTKHKNQKLSPNSFVCT